GPLRKGFLKRAAVYLFNKAKIVTVRDKESQNYMMEYGVKRDIIVTSDSAQIVNYSFFEHENIQTIQEIEKLEDKHVVLVHLPINNVSEYSEIVIEAIKDSLFDDTNIGFLLTYDGDINNDYIKN